MSGRGQDDDGGGCVNGDKEEDLVLVRGPGAHSPIPVPRKTARIPELAGLIRSGNLGILLEVLSVSVSMSTFFRRRLGP